MLPLKIGAALRIDAIADHRDWLFGDNRDLEIPDFIFYETYKNGWQDTVDRAKAELDGFEGRIGIHGPFIGLDINNPDPEVCEVASRRYVAGIEAAAALGARQMVIHSPFNIWTHHHKHAGYGGDAAIAESVRTLLEPALKLGESHGVTMVVENTRDARAEDRRALAEYIGSPALAVSLDTGHANIACNILGSQPVDYFVRDAGNLLRHVHLQDNDAQADRHWAPGDGTIIWHAVFQALSELESAPHLVLELRHHQDIPKGFGYLRDLGLAI